MSKELSIFLENDKRYYPGDMIKGTLNILLDLTCVFKKR